jgi:hypothetical protein
VAYRLREAVTGASDDDWRELLAVLARERSEQRKEN